MFFGKFLHRHPLDEFKTTANSSSKQSALTHNLSAWIYQLEHFPVRDHSRSMGTTCGRVNCSSSTLISWSAACRGISPSPTWKSGRGNTTRPFFWPLFVGIYCESLEANHFQWHFDQLFRGYGTCACPQRISDVVTVGTCIPNIINLKIVNN